MTESSYSMRDIKIQHLHSIYKKYTDFIINFEKHMDKLYSDWVIDVNNRNYVLQQMDNMVRKMIKIYNINLLKIYKDHEMSLDTDTLSDTDISSGEKRSEYEGIYKNFYNAIDMVNMMDDKKIATLVTDATDENNLFGEIRSELLELGLSNGFLSLEEFFNIYINEYYHYLFARSDLEIFNIYKKVFVPLNAKIESLTTKNKTDTKIVVNPIPTKCDSLIDTTMSISICLETLGVIITFEGYISSDVLNVYVRTSQIYSKYIFNIKRDLEDLLKKSYPNMDMNFQTRYLKFIGGSAYFIYSPKLFVERMAGHYQLYTDITSKGFNMVMKDFIHGDVRNMFNIINLLLLGTEQNICTAVLLFNLLKDRKVSGETLSDIIYHNLSYYAQIKLKKVSNNMKAELNRIKTLTPENVSIEKKLASLVNMPDSVKSYILEKVSEIKSGENNYKLQMAINGLMQFPWKPKDAKNEFGDIRKSMSKSRDYLQNVAKKLDETVFGHENSKKVLIELVGKWIQNPESSGQVIGLVGPPGVGKTLLAKSISVALGIPLAIVGLGGMSDSADLIGHSFTYAGAQYGMIVRQMIKTGGWRCVMFFDEVDKVARRNDTNEIYNTLIHITDPNMNQHFQDRFYSSSIEFDLSGVLIVFSYNSSEKLDPILLDRIKEIPIAAYSVQEKITIAQGYVMKELCENIGFVRDKIHFDDSTIRYIIEKYTVEAGVRELRRKLEQILLKLNIDRFYMRGPFRELMNKRYDSENSKKGKKIRVLEIDDLSDEPKSGLSNYVEYKKSKVEDMLDADTLNKIFNLEFEDKVVITLDLIHKYLEKPVMMVEEIHKNNLIGVINGLYATNIGMGGIVPIQIFKNYIGDCHDGTNLKLKLTGNQKQVMRESVICALTTAVNLLNKDVRDNIMNNFPHGFHIHAPDGGTPKDGPSAGCAFTTAFVSVLLGKKVNREIAMTGEIELTGKVSKIGGLEAKLNGAKKAGVKKVFICDENKEDYENIKKKSPEIFDENFSVEIITHIIELVSNPEIIIGVSDSDFDKDTLIEYRKKK
jgi:endopeptidase La